MMGLIICLDLPADHTFLGPHRSSMTLLLLSNLGRLSLLPEDLSFTQTGISPESQVDTVLNVFLYEACFCSRYTNNDWGGLQQS